MIPLEAFDAERFIFVGGLWSVAALAWAAACLWVERDARVVFGGSRAWKIAVLAIGILLLVGTFVAGFSAIPWAVVTLTLVMLGYVGYRDTRALPAQRLVPTDVIASGVRGGARLLGLKEWLAGGGQGVGPTRSAETLVLMKKDGSVYGGGARGLDPEISQAVSQVKEILGEAIAMRATDIHLEPKVGQDTQVRYRIDGMMQNRSVLGGEEGRAVVSALKVLGDMDIAERRRPQDGTFAVVASGRKFDVRAASGPTNFGEKMALRLLDAEGGIVKAGLGGLGMRDSMVQALRGIIHRSHGMLIVSGPTGSGKTTSVYGALGEIDVLTRNIITIEDPVEYRLDNISQTAVNNAAELTFAKILRSVLRQDPDVILVGEIRDKETAEIAMQAALTGHFVFTTLHANDTATTITRLLDIGIEATLIQSAVTAVLAQRLIRLLCPKCKEAYQPPEDLLRRHGIAPDKVKVLFKEKGCPECHGTGYRGRTGIYELMILDATIRGLLVGRPSIEAIRAVTKKNGMRTLWRSALYKVCEGATSMAEAERVIQ